MKLLIKYALAVSCAIIPLATQAQIDFALLDITRVDYVTPGTHSFDVVAEIVGPGFPSSMTVCWTQNNGPVQSVTENTSNIDFNYLIGRAINSKYVLSVPIAGTYDIKVWLQITGDNNPANDTITKTIRVAPNLSKKNVLLEVFKQQVCGPCYPAAQFLDSVVIKNKDYSIASIYTFPTDVLLNASGAEVDDTFKFAHPAPLFDRFKFPYNKFIYSSFIKYANGSYRLSNYLEREEYLEPVEVSIKNATYDSVTRELKVKVKAKFFDNLNGDYRFNLYVLEDSIKAYQAAAPSPYNYYHMHVVRQMLGGAWGLANSIPGPIASGYEAEYEFTTNLPATYKTRHIKLIGLVQVYNNDKFKRRILNSQQLTLKQATTVSTDNITMLQETINIYPNPAKEKIKIAFHEAGDYTVTMQDINGRTVAQQQTSSTQTEIDLRQLAAGSYILKVDNGRQVYSQLILKQD